MAVRPIIDRLRGEAALVGVTLERHVPGDPVLAACARRWAAAFREAADALEPPKRPVFKLCHVCGYALGPDAFGRVKADGSRHEVCFAPPGD